MNLLCCRTTLRGTDRIYLEDLRPNFPWSCYDVGGYIRSGVVAPACVSFCYNGTESGSSSTYGIWSNIAWWLSVGRPDLDSYMQAAERFTVGTCGCLAYEALGNVYLFPEYDEWRIISLNDGPVDTLIEGINGKVSEGYTGNITVKEDYWSCFNCIFPSCCGNGRLIDVCVCNYSTTNDFPVTVNVCEDYWSCYGGCKQMSHLNNGTRVYCLEMGYCWRRSGSYNVNTGLTWTTDWSRTGEFGHADNTYYTDISRLANSLACNINDGLYDGVYVGTTFCHCR